MNFAFFESLSKDEADLFLENYLRVEKKAVHEMIATAEEEGIYADFSIESVNIVLKWLFKKVKTFPQKIDKTLPRWIRECDSYLKGLVDFEEGSKILLLRGSYYLGECFVRCSSDALTWSTGNIETAEQNMPVITGFQHGLEMAPMLIVQNLCLRIIADGAPESDVDRAIKLWFSNVP